MAYQSLNIEIPYKRVEGKPDHGKLLQELSAHYRSGMDKRGQRNKQWREAENLYLAYAPKSEADRLREDKRDSGTPTYTTIQIPYSYAILLTAHTYWSSVFLGRDPIFQYDGRHGEPAQQVQAVEAIISYQALVGQFLPVLYGWLLDAGKYGIGVICDYWCEDYEVISTAVEAEQKFLKIFPTGRTKREIVRSRERVYAGNRLFNVRPYDFYWDPRVSFVNLQSGEFCGRRVEVNRNYILKRRDQYFNLEHIDEASSNRASMDREWGSPATNLPDDVSSTTVYGSRRGPDELIEEHWELVPKDWKLGDSGTPEKWIFTVLNKSLIIGARPAGEDHNRYPYFGLAYEIDPYSHISRGMMEVTKPLNDAMTWLLESHMSSVRQSINGNWAVDPSKFVMKDFEGGAGRLVRLKPSAYGTDIRMGLFQFNTPDPTAQNVRDMGLFKELIQWVTGVNENMLGAVNPGGRKTATEVRHSTTFGVNRLKTFCEYNSALGWSPLAKVLLQNTQQYLDEELMVRLVGDLPLGNRQSLKVSPAEIAGFYDFIPVDGTLPIDRFAQANLWKEIIFGISKVPQIAMQYDIGGIFSWMAQLAGLKNITQFKIQVTPDQQLMAAAASGESVPVGDSLSAVGQGTGLPAGMGTNTGSGVGPVQ